MVKGVDAVYEDGGDVAVDTGSGGGELQRVGPEAEYVRSGKVSCLYLQGGFIADGCPCSVSTSIGCLLDLRCG
jgi:hypothetical protein